MLYMQKVLNWLEVLERREVLEVRDK